MLLRPSWDCADTENWIKWWDGAPKDILCGTREWPPFGVRISRDAALALALSEALRGTGNVSPNPLVGAVIVGREYEFISAGAHLRVGDRHAEVAAVNSAGDVDLSGATIFITLEPCAHHGRTPPCAEMLARSKIQNIVYICDDPNKNVNGRGVQILRSAGKSVEQDLAWRSRAEDLAEIFFCNQRENRIFVGIKIASTWDGLYAGVGTGRLWITGERARNYGHYLRLRYDAILVGANTVLQDNPTLNVRHPSLSGRTPLRIVLDPKGELAQAARGDNLRLVEPKKTLWLVGSNINSGALLNIADVNVKSLKLNENGHFSWDDIYGHLWSIGVRSLLIEGGAGIWKNVLASGYPNKLHWFIAGTAGNFKGQSWNPPLGVTRYAGISSAIALDGDRYVEISDPSRR